MEVFTACPGSSYPPQRPFVELNGTAVVQSHFPPFLIFLNRGLAQPELAKSFCRLGGQCYPVDIS